MEGCLFARNGKMYRSQDLRRERSRVLAGSDVVFRPSELFPEFTRREGLSDDEEFNDLLLKAMKRVNTLKDKGFSPQKTARKVADWLKRENPWLVIQVGDFNLDMVGYECSISLATPEMAKKGEDFILGTTLSGKEKAAKNFLDRARSQMAEGAFLVIKQGGYLLIPQEKTLDFLKSLAEAIGQDQLEGQVRKLADLRDFSEEEARRFTEGVSRDLLMAEIRKRTKGGTDKMN